MLGRGIWRRIYSLGMPSEDFKEAMLDEELYLFKMKWTGLFWTASRVLARLLRKGSQRDEAYSVLGGMRDVHTASLTCGDGSLRLRTMNTGVKLASLAIWKYDLIILGYRWRLRQSIWKTTMTLEWCQINSMSYATAVKSRRKERSGLWQHLAMLGERRQLEHHRKSVC